MRIIIKDADFSQVSIGKVVKDLSFNFDAQDGVDAINDFFPNYNSGGTVGSTTYYTGEEGGTVVANTGPNRIVSEYHEVSEDMTIQCIGVVGGSTSVPALVAFDSNKNIVSSACAWYNDYDFHDYLVPEGVKYVKFQTNSVLTTGLAATRVNASMPN